MQETKELDKLLKRFTPQDVIGAILAYSELPTFPSDRERLHKFIREQKKGGGAELLGAFVFSEGVDLYPFSRLLESVLMGLQLGGWLSAKNPEFDRFELPGPNRTDIKKKVGERFSGEQLTILKKIGQDFREFMEKEHQK